MPHFAGRITLTTRSRGKLSRVCEMWNYEVMMYVDRWCKGNEVFCSVEMLCKVRVVM